MKTNQVMIRQIGCFNVEQRTKDGMFNATALLRQWNESSGQQKQISHFFENDNTKEFVEALLEEEKLKERNSAYIKIRGKHGGTWMHPILFVKFAMWLNPHFEVQVIKFVYDQMIAYRNDAGDAYKELSCAVDTIVTREFMKTAMSKIAEGINWCVFNHHKPMVRNEHGSEKKMRELFQFEKKLADLINEGFLKDYKSVMNYLRTRWIKMQTPRLLTE